MSVSPVLMLGKGVCMGTGQGTSSRAYAALIIEGLIPGYNRIKARFLRAHFSCKLGKWGGLWT